MNGDKEVTCQALGAWGASRMPKVKWGDGIVVLMHFARKVANKRVQLYTACEAEVQGMERDNVI